MEDFIPYNEALALNELGFDKFCFGFYLDNYTKVEARYPCVGVNKAPLYSQSFRFFRDKFNIEYSIKPFYYPESSTVKYRWDCIKIIMLASNKSEIKEEGGATFSYEEAELACLKKLIEIAKKE